MQKLCECVNEEICMDLENQQCGDVLEVGS
jgi:hypothetical protein